MAKNTIESFGHSRFFCLLLQGKVSNLLYPENNKLYRLFRKFHNAYKRSRDAVEGCGQFPASLVLD